MLASNYKGKEQSGNQRQEVAESHDLSEMLRAAVLGRRRIGLCRRIGCRQSLVHVLELAVDAVRHNEHQDETNQQA